MSVSKYIQLCLDSTCFYLQGNVPPNSKTDTHQGPRHSKLAMEQMVSCSPQAEEDDMLTNACAI